MKSKKTAICQNPTCKKEFIYKDKRAMTYCSKKCLGNHTKNENIKLYNQNPKKCIYCNELIPYDNKHNDFCNGSCSAKFNNKKRNENGWVMTKTTKQQIGQSNKNNYHPKTKIKTCTICGHYYDGTSVCKKSIWCNISRGKSRTTNLLASTFNIKLGLPSTILNLNNALKLINKLYTIDKLSSAALKTYLNMSCTTGHISNFLKALGIKRRSFKEALQEALLNNRTSLPPTQIPYKSGNHIDWQGNEHYYRSSYELDMYKELDNRQIPYKSESLRIKFYDTQQQKFRVAIPDILCWGKVILEIKSSWTYNQQEMDDKFLAYRQQGYKAKLVLEHKML